MNELTCANCPFDVERPNGKPFCIQDATCEISVNWLNEHDSKIRADAISEAMHAFCEWLGHRYGDKTLGEVEEMLKGAE